MSNDFLKFFNEIDSSFEEEAARKDEIFKVVKEYDKTCRHINAILNTAHSAKPEEIASIGQKAIDNFGEVKNHLEKTLQTSLFLAAFAIYLSTDKLITIDLVEDLFNVKINIGNDIQDFHIPIEDFLYGYINLTNELSRLAVNSVTVGDYDRPIRISKFVKELYTGFQLLNLKNDNLRKRFDGIKTSLFLAAFAIYLSTDKLITIDLVEDLFNVKINIGNDIQDFHIPIEDFLYGYINLTNELSRLAVNSVTVGDYDRPIRISKFVKELYTGFQLLNLKNDNLRKRFDGIKYNIKKIEEVSTTSALTSKT
ncbi:350_t:CDS:10 [Entrophospora sp. SA101]|nr:350_t:CDS:10 [Entrophospora sp. SA101]CAJ0906106.1 8028_t:CDS:10 [Entrophospora sp. SA101]